MILTVTLNAAIDKRYQVKKLRLGEVNRVLECQCSAGGKGLNVARVAVLAGEQATAFGFAGFGVSQKFPISAFHLTDFFIGNLQTAFQYFRLQASFLLRNIKADPAFAANMHKAGSNSVPAGKLLQ